MKPYIITSLDSKHALLAMARAVAGIVQQRSLET